MTLLGLSMAVVLTAHGALTTSTGVDDSSAYTKGFVAGTEDQVRSFGLMRECAAIKLNNRAFVEAEWRSTLATVVTRAQVSGSLAWRSEPF